jgi:hypothetical protein
MLLLSLRRQFLLTARHKRIGHLQHLKMFDDKINCRILHDFREMPAWICDKRRVRAVRLFGLIRCPPGPCPVGVKNLIHVLPTGDTHE